MNIFNGFDNDNDNYIVLKKLAAFIKENCPEKYKSSYFKDDLINIIDCYSNKDADNKEKVLEFIDSSLAEGKKEVQLYLVEENKTHQNILLKLKKVKNKHLTENANQELEIFRVEEREDKLGKSIRLFLAKKLRFYSNLKVGNYRESTYPIIIDYYYEESLLVGRAKSKSNMYELDGEKEFKTDVKKEIETAVNFIENKLDITIKREDVSTKFQSMLYELLMEYTKTPEEIKTELEKNKNIRDEIVGLVYSVATKTPKDRKDNVEYDVNNMLEKYLSIYWEETNIFVKNKMAYPYKLKSTDSEQSKVTQESLEPLQSKSSFFDNKKILQNEKKCEVIHFKFKGLNLDNEGTYKDNNYNVKMVMSSSKKNYAQLSFTEYTAEEDIVNVIRQLFIKKGVREVFNKK